MLSIKNTCCAVAMLGMIGVATTALATDIGDAVTVNDYFAQNNDVFIDDIPVGGNASTLKATESMIFTGTTILDSESGTSYPSNVTFEAPEINMESEISIADNGKNSVTFNNALVNFDKATWDSDTDYQGPIAFSGTSGVKVTSDSLSQNPLITASELSGDVNLVFDNGAISDGAPQDLKLVNESANTDNLNVNKIKDNPLYNIQSGTTNGTFSVAQRSADDIASQGYTDLQANLLKSMLSISASDNPYFNSIATLVQMGQDSAAKSALDGLRPATAAANQAAFEATASTIRAIYNHIVPANDPEILSGMKEKNHITPWIEGMYTHSRNDMENQGYQMHQAGYALGLDTFVGSNVLLGVGFSQITGRFEADIGGQTDLDGYTGFIYGAWKPSQWFVSAMANYSKMKYDHSGIEWDADVYGAQGTVGYEWGWIDAGVGLRYIRVESDSYTNAFGTNVDTKDADVVTGLLGVHMQKVFKDDNGWRLVPSVHAAVTYDLKAADDEASVAYNGQHLYTFVGEKQKRLGAEIGAGLKLTDGPAEVSLSYEGAFRKKSFSNGGYLTVKYHF